MSNVRIPWRNVWLGSIVTAVLFSLGKFVLGLYRDKKATESTLGVRVDNGPECPPGVGHGKGRTREDRS
jgi:hypothetical protein